MKWHLEIFDSLQSGDYQRTIEFYETLIDQQPETITNYWLLGIAYILDGRGEESIATWFSLLDQVEDMDELSEILEDEALRQKNSGNTENSLLLREYITQIEPHLPNNLLLIVSFSIELETFTISLIDEIGLVESLAQAEPGSVDFEILLSVLEKVLLYPNIKSVELLNASLVHISPADRFIDRIYSQLSKLLHQLKHVNYVIDIIQTCLQSATEDDRLLLLGTLYGCHILENNYQKARETIEQLVSSSTDFDTQFYGRYLSLDVALRQGEFLESETLLNNYKEAIESIDLIKNRVIHRVIKGLLPTLTHILFYIEDNPRQIRALQNRLSQLFQNSLGDVNTQQANQSQQKIKIGYISCNFRRHSIGWLSRWLIYHHDREKFEIHLYLINQNEDDITAKWFLEKADFVNRLSDNTLEVSQKIQSDQLDILIDLDSMTSATNCWVLALKPATIQITWLGLDATGIPNVDYFLVDPHVVPSDAQQYYQEKLWRLPRTYLAVDGFEVGLPDLTRADLDIPNDAIIYLTSQSGYKRHPETIKLQLAIVKAVPNSYLLVKGFANGDIVKELFFKLAQQEDVPIDRLRFIPYNRNEETHRANLQIADVVLDTYPYNGATTTLEVLWMGIPIVTLVGQQFAARNSYTFMLNAGISEGIAYSPQEYIEWGIKLGINEDLRSSIHWKLVKSRQSEPLWNAKQFTRDIEDAYVEIIHLQKEA